MVDTPTVATKSSEIDNQSRDLAPEKKSSGIEERPNPQETREKANAARPRGAKATASCSKCHKRMARRGEHSYLVA